MLAQRIFAIRHVTRRYGFDGYANAIHHIRQRAMLLLLTLDAITRHYARHTRKDDITPPQTDVTDEERDVTRERGYRCRDGHFDITPC